MNISLYPVVCTIVGLILWAVCYQPKTPTQSFIGDVAKIMFAAGLLVSLFVFAGEHVRL